MIASVIILFLCVVIGVTEFFTHFRIERVEELPDIDDLPGDALIVEADTVGELIDALVEIPRSTSAANLWIVPHEEQ